MRAPAECQSMADVRSAIDALDQEIVTLLASRAAFIDRASELKQGLGWPARIPERVEEVGDQCQIPCDAGRIGSRHGRGDVADAGKLVN